MASYFNLTLDTLPPAGVVLKINGDALYATSPEVELSIVTTDEDTTGYKMLIWGIDGAATEADATWETYVSTKAVTLSGEDGSKTVSVRIMDDVGNQSPPASDSITLDTVVPAVTITGPDRDKISKFDSLAQNRDTAIINFQSSVDFVEYKVCVVPATNSTQNAGITIGTEFGSDNTSQVLESTEGLLPANTNIEVTIKGADLEAASSGDGVKIIKVFVRTKAGNWSVA